MTLRLPVRILLSAALCSALSLPVFAQGPEDKLGPIKGESAAATVDKIGPIKGESHNDVAIKFDGVEGESFDREHMQAGPGQELLNVPMGDMIRPSAAAAPSGCKMLDGSADENCDGAADTVPAAVQKGEGFYRIEGHMGSKAAAATDYNSSRSNKNTNH